MVEFLFNTIDLEMAYGAGQRAGFMEASDKAATLPYRVMFDAGYEAGVQAERNSAVAIRGG